jgi:hypothetical protein
MQLTGQWRSEIRSAWGVRMFEGGKAATTLFWLTRCAPTKAKRPSLPHLLYRSTLTAAFFRFVQDAGLRFGVLSDLYGVHLDWEKLHPYDIHPSGLRLEDKQRLGTIVAEKVRGEKFNAVVFYNNSPLRSVPYFEILSHSGLEVYFTTRLLEVPRR